MNFEEAMAWLRGERSYTNIIQSDVDNNRSWVVATAQADAAATEQAYWVVRANSESLVKSEKEVILARRFPEMVG